MRAAAQARRRLGIRFMPGSVGVDRSVQTSVSRWGSISDNLSQLLSTLRERRRAGYSAAVKLNGQGTSTVLLPFRNRRRPSPKADLRTLWPLANTIAKHMLARQHSISTATPEVLAGKTHFIRAANHKRLRLPSTRTSKLPPLAAVKFAGSTLPYFFVCGPLNFHC
ncbi:hypothetical protein NPIL_633441 [Nephila pilipes]|uniref:Uncharacterized protein n=1 Tax=Nephila pilipes TaxID=299642 RepID=A0A8X6IRA3_NEPPI|nr:hypothetical protein NPIL_633441 [Nephila pilipes]